MKARLVFVFLTLVAVGAVSLALAGTATAAGELFGDLDNRAGKVQPNATQLSIVSGLGATATWNRFGTPSMLTKDGGTLATVSGADPTEAALNFVSANMALWRLTAVTELEPYAEVPLAGSKLGYAVTFQQEFGGLKGAEAFITVGVVGSPSSWKVVSASSTATANQGLAASPSLSPKQAWIIAAKNVGYNYGLPQLTSYTKLDRDWTIFGAAGLTQVQRSRLVALPTPSNGVRPAYETIVLDVQGGKANAWQHWIDAATGKVWVRKNIVDASHPPSDTETGEMPDNPATECAPRHGPYVVGPTESVGSVAAFVEAFITTNDSVMNIYRDNVLVASADTLFSPEAAIYDPPDNGQGVYETEVCEFTGTNWTENPGPDYTTSVFFAPVDAGVPFPPMWFVFEANPLLGLQQFPWNMPNTDNGKLWCWDANVGGVAVQGPAGPPANGRLCDRELQNPASRAPWDFDPATEQPTFTTRGNNNWSAEAWTSPLTPGPEHYMPVKSDRKYVFPWNNTWFNEKCDPTSLVPGNPVTNAGEPDLARAVTNLFAMHNEMHDWQYFLGFTEEAWNAQQSNFGTGGTLPNDPLQGDVQAGAVDGAFPSFTGRDNANMITLPDGIPSITNMYLWQPIPAAFYPPCVDGDFDMAVIGHEFGHMTENRMIGKGGGRTGAHAGAMGESFGDFNAAEHLIEMGFVPVSGENPFSVGAYVTGNHERGIRNFGMNWAYAGDVPRPGVTPEVNPLNFSDVGYDLTGPQVHADGEMHSRIQFTIRELLVAKYNGLGFPASNANLQRRCAFGDLADNPDQCPGNRRWIQLYFDAMLLMPVGPSFIDMRNAMLAADQARVTAAGLGGQPWPSNEVELWRAFGRTGIGDNAFSNGNGDTQPIPSFESRVENDEATVTFTVRERQSATKTRPINTAKIFVGWYEFDVTPIADTNPATPTAAPPAGVENNQDNVAKFVPGTYEFVAQAPGFGHFRFRLTLTANQNRNVVITIAPNFASRFKGATASGDGANHLDLIDDTEGTNWDCLAPCKANPGLNDVEGAQVTVDLHGNVARSIRQVNVSAMIRPGQGGRFTTLRQFEILFCNANTAPNCTDAANFLSVLTSTEDAFPGASPRPASNDMILRSFTIPGTVKKATHVQIRVLDNQCTGQPEFQDPGDPLLTDQDNDPTFDTDCRIGSGGTVVIIGVPDVLAPANNSVRIAELQTFEVAGTVAG